MGGLYEYSYAKKYTGPGGKSLDEHEQNLGQTGFCLRAVATIRQGSPMFASVLSRSGLGPQRAV